MIQDANQLTSLPFYTAEIFQDRYKWWVQSIYRLISTNDRFLPFQIVKAPTAGGGGGGGSCPELPTSVGYTADFSVGVDGWSLAGDGRADAAALSIDTNRLKIVIPAGNQGWQYEISRKLVAQAYEYTDTDVDFTLNADQSAKLRKTTIVSVNEDFGVLSTEELVGGYNYQDVVTATTTDDILSIIVIPSTAAETTVYLTNSVLTATPSKVVDVTLEYEGTPFLTTDSWTSDSAATLSAVSNNLRLTWNGEFGTNVSRAFNLDITNASSIRVAVDGTASNIIGVSLELRKTNGDVVFRTTDDIFFWGFASNGVYEWVEDLADYTELISVSLGMERVVVETSMDFTQIDVSIGSECVEPVSDIWTTATLINAKTEAETDVTTYMNANTVGLNYESDAYQVAIYDASVALSTDIEPGYYYLKLNDGTDIFYSEVFLPCENLDSYVKIEWWRDIDILYTGGRIVYTTGYINTAYLDGDVGKPEHSYEIEQTERNGTKFKQKIVSIKKFSIKNLLLSEAVIDVLARIPHHEYVTILSNYLYYQVTDITIPAPEWEEDGDLAQLPIEFETDTIISTGTSITQNYNQLLGDPTDAINIRGNNKRIYQLGDAINQNGLYVPADKLGQSEAVRIPISDLLGVAEAPLDGLKYGRVDGDWEDSSINIEKMDFTGTTQAYKLGRLHYDSVTNTFTAYTDIPDTSLQIGEELRSRLLNDLGFTGLNGKAVSISGSTGSDLKIDLLDCSNIDSSTRAHGLLTTDILDEAPGYSVRFGLVRELDTSLIPAQSIVYGDPLIPGEWTATRPGAPYYPVRLGVCLVSSATAGVIMVDTLAFNGTDTTVNNEGELNGIVLNTPNVVFSVDAGIIYADVTNETFPTRVLPFMLGGVRYDLDTLTNTGASGAARITVPPGASTILKQTSLIYIYLNSGVPTLAVTTSTPTVPYCTVAYVAVFNAARTVTDGRVFAYRRHNNVTNRLDGTHDGSFGLFLETLWAIRNKLGSNWISGQSGTATVNDTTIRLALTAGVGAQFRRTDLPAFDGLNYLIYNTTANVVTYESSTNLTDIQATADGSTLLSNNTFYTIRLFYQLNSNGIGNSVIATRPLGKYTTSAEAVSDPLNYNVAVNDTDIEEIVYPLYDLVISRTGGTGGTITLVKLVDKRSKLASGVGGGGASGGGGTDDKVRISAADTTNAYLNDKLLGTTGEIVSTLTNAGANEQLVLSLPGTVTKALNFSSGITVDSGQTYQPENGLKFGDGNTAWYERLDNVMQLRLGGVNVSAFSSGGFGFATSEQAAISSAAATAVVPSLRPASSDSNTGIGRAGADQLSLIAGGVEGLRIEAGVQKFAGQAIGGDEIKTFAATPEFDFNSGNTQEITLTANLTSWTIANSQPAGQYTLYFIQDATGGWTIPSPTGITKVTDNSLTAFETQANAINIVNVFITPSGVSIWSLVEVVTT